MAWIRGKETELSLRHEGVLKTPDGYLKLGFNQELLFVQVWDDKTHDCLASIGMGLQDQLWLYKNLKKRFATSP